MNNAGNIERLQCWSILAETIRYQHTSHERRRPKIFLLSSIMKHHMTYVTDPEMRLIEAACQEVLSYVQNVDYLTHSDVKDGLSLFVMICESAIYKWSPKPYSFQKAVQETLDEYARESDDVGEIPF